MDHRFWMLIYEFIFASFCVFLSATVDLAEAQQVIFLVRHAEQLVEGEDPPLSEIGRVRAAELAALLKDTGINAIYESGIRRTSETAKPLADLLNVKPKVYPRTDINGFIGSLRSQHAQDRVLIVSQSLRISRWLKAFGHSAEITITPRDYGDLFVIVPKDDGAPLVLRLHY